MTVGQLYEFLSRYDMEREVITINSAGAYSVALAKSVEPGGPILLIQGFNETNWLISLREANIG